MVSMISSDGEDGAVDQEAGPKHGGPAPGHALSQLLLQPWRWLRGRQGFELLVDQADSPADRRPAGAMAGYAQDFARHGVATLPACLAARGILRVWAMKTPRLARSSAFADYSMALGKDHGP